jgi:hypothetical protein
VREDRIEDTILTALAVFASFAEFELAQLRDGAVDLQVRAPEAREPSRARHVQLCAVIAPQEHETIAIGAIVELEALRVRQKFERLLTAADAQDASRPQGKRNELEQARLQLCAPGRVPSVDGDRVKAAGVQPQSLGAALLDLVPIRARREGASWIFLDPRDREPAHVQGSEEAPGTDAQLADALPADEAVGEVCQPAALWAGAARPAEK